MEATLQQYHIDVIKNAKAVVVDLSDTIVKGNASYGAFYTVGNKLKKGKFLDAIKLGSHGIRIYLESHYLRRDLKEWDKENYILTELHQCLHKHDVSGKEMEDGAGKYIEMFENSGAKSFLRKIKNFGTNKELVLMTRESSECAKAAKRCFGFDRYISNITKLKNNGTIGHIEIIMKKPERKLELLQKELEKNGLELGDAVIISDNPEDPPLFKEKVGLFITYKDRNGELNISDYREFERKLIGSD